MKEYTCAICGKQIKQSEDEKLVGTDFVTYGYACQKCQHGYDKIRIAELLDVPGVVTLK